MDGRTESSLGCLMMIMIIIHHRHPDMMCLRDGPRSSLAKLPSPCVAPLTLLYPLLTHHHRPCRHIAIIIVVVIIITFVSEKTKKRSLFSETSKCGNKQVPIALI